MWWNSVLYIMDTYCKSTNTSLLHYHQYTISSSFCIQIKKYMSDVYTLKHAYPIIKQSLPCSWLKEQEYLNNPLSMLILDVQLSKNMKLMWEDVTLKSLFSHILIIKVAKTSLFGFMMLITNTNTCTRGQFHSPILCFHKLPNQTTFHNVGTR